MFNSFLFYLFYKTNETQIGCLWGGATYFWNIFMWFNFQAICIYDFVWSTRFNVLLQQKSLTSTPRPLVSPAPHPIGQALDVGGANAVVPRVAGEDYFRSILIVRTVDDPPFPMVQREGAETRAHNNCAKKKKKKKRGFGGEWTLLVLDYSNGLTSVSISSLIPCTHTVTSQNP